MGTVPILRTWSTGEIVTAAELNSNVRDSVNFLLATPRCIRTSSGGHTLGDGISPSALNFDTTTVDTDGMHSGTNNFLTAQTPGLFEIFVQVHFNATTTVVGETRYCMAGFQINNSSWGSGSWITQDVRVVTQSTSYGTSCNVGLEVKMQPGDIVYFFYAESTGQSLTVNAGNFGSQVTMQWVATT